jgi:hypothetical protein
MKVVYKEEAVSVLKAMFYAEFTGCEAVAEHCNKELSLFNEPTVEADDLDITDLITKLRLAKKKPGLFASFAQLKTLENLVGWVLRHGSSKKHQVIQHAIRKAIHDSVLPVINGINAEGKQLLKFAEEVQAEVRLSGQEIRFTLMPHAENVLYSRYTLKHDTSDLVIQLWSRIYPEYTFVLLLPNKTIIGNRFGHEEWNPLYGSPAKISQKIAASKLLNHPQRSQLASRHAHYVNMSREQSMELSYTKTVNYVDFYNKIKRGEELL